MSDLFARIVAFGNLWQAGRRAARGKRTIPEAADWLCRLERNTLELAAELSSGDWRPAGYRTFRVTDPKERLICAAPFRDRVVHQALVQVLEPIFEPSFIHDSYACRRGRGTHRALKRVYHWAGTYPWCLKLDVEKYFPSVDHRTCLDLVARKVRCSATLEILRRFLASWTSSEAPLRWFPGDDLFAPGTRPRGLPIGNLTSQFLANVYLDPVDHRIKDGLGVRPYARYCDDLVVLGRGPGELRELRQEIVQALGRLRLTAHPRKTQVFPTAQGISWVGFRVHPGRIRLRMENVGRARRRFRRFAGLLDRNQGDPVRIAASVQAWRAHASHAGASKLVDALTSPLA